MLLVLLMRHGESEANATKQDIPDPDITALGVAQADAWRARSATWELETVLVSPLLRTIQTAARAFGAHPSARWQLCPAAREHWWDMRQSRGRLGGEIAPALAELPACGLTAEAVVAAIGAPTEHWHPTEEAAASKRELGRRSARATLALATDLTRRAAAGEKRVAVVCHWGVVSALTDVDAANCDVVGLLFHPGPAAESGRRNAYRDAVAALGWSYDVLGPWTSADAIPLLEPARGANPP